MDASRYSERMYNYLDEIKIGWKDFFGVQQYLIITPTSQKIVLYIPNMKDNFDFIFTKNHEIDP